MDNPDTMAPFHIFLFLKTSLCQAVVLHAFSFSTWEATAGGSL